MIGRFCLTYGDDDVEEWTPPEEEPERIVRSRDRLLDELDRVAGIIPGDQWVVGQRVRYLVEAERFGAARSAARACRAESWWCDALLAFAAHHEGDSAAADSAYSSTLATMPEELQREWTDLTIILDGPARRLYRSLSGPERTEFEDRFWRLANPLLGTPGNDVRSEHLSRNVFVQFQDRAESTENLSWGDDLREILVRFGSPSGWERVRPAVAGLGGDGPSLLSHYPDGDLDLLPPAEILSSLNPAAGVWDTDDRRARASYPLPRAGERLRWFVPFEHQVAIFRDRDSALVVAAYDLPADSLSEGATVDASLVYQASIDATPVRVHRPAAGTRSVLAISTPQAPLLVSLEAVADEERWAGRARFGVDVPRLLPGLLAASDLLIVDVAGDSLPEARAEAISLARGSLRVSPGEKIGVYWELYGLTLPRSEVLNVSLRLVDSDAGWLRRMAERIGVVQQVQPIRLVWGEEAGAAETVRRSLAIQIPDDLSPGEYSLELSVAAPGREPLVSRRTLQVTP
jgi:hypothetical protein